MSFSWTEFFTQAGIPSSHAVSYAEVFEDNRIRRDMLCDLTKELLQEMGVAVLGDVIAILKHAKACLDAEVAEAKRIQAEAKRQAAQQALDAKNAAAALAAAVVLASSAPTSSATPAAAHTFAATAPSAAAPPPPPPSHPKSFVPGAHFETTDAVHRPKGKQQQPQQPQQLPKQAPQQLAQPASAPSQAQATERIIRKRKDSLDEAIRGDTAAAGKLQQVGNGFITSRTAKAALHVKTQSAGGVFGRLGASGAPVLTFVTSASPSVAATTAAAAAMLGAAPPPLLLQPQLQLQPQPQPPKKKMKGRGGVKPLALDPSAQETVFSRVGIVPPRPTNSPSHVTAAAAARPKGSVFARLA